MKDKNSYHPCKCGCGHLARGEYKQTHRPRKHPRTYIEEDRGYKTPCWVWQGSSNHKGYAYGSLDGCKHGVYIYREFYKRNVGPIPEGKELDHLCRIRMCVNPQHLELVTHTENIRRGSNAKLNIKTAKEIRELRRSGRYTILSLAHKYNVSKTTIKRVLYAVTWTKEMSEEVTSLTGIRAKM